MDVFGPVRIVLDEVEHVTVVGVQEADVVMAAQLEGEVKLSFVLPPLLTIVPCPEVTAVKHRPHLSPEGRLVENLSPPSRHLTHPPLALRLGKDRSRESVQLVFATSSR